MSHKAFSKTFVAVILSIINLKAIAQLDTVKVTAQKRTELLQKTPLAVSSLNSQQINTLTHQTQTCHLFGLKLKVDTFYISF